MATIVQLRGTSGSGKSTAVRAVMDELRGWIPTEIPGRKRPYFYSRFADARTAGRDTIVMGHYEIDCGGCDTIGSAPETYKAIVYALTMLPHSVMLSEGLLWGEDVKWTVQLRKDGHTVYPLFLTTSREECLRRVVERQSGREPADPERVDRKLTRRITTIESARRRLVDAGFPCRRCSSDQSVRIILGLLRNSI